MAYENPVRIEASIKRLTREIEEIEGFFYGASKETDRHVYRGMLERKRDDVIRSAVLQFHTATEEIIKKPNIYR